MHFKLTALMLIPSALVASLANTSPNVKLISPNEVEGQTVGSHGEIITNRVAVNPHEARIFKHAVHDTPNGHAEMKMESRIHVKYDDKAKEQDALRSFIHKADFDVPAVKDAGESMTK